MDYLPSVASFLLKIKCLINLYNQFVRTANLLSILLGLYHTDSSEIDGLKGLVNHSPVWWLITPPFCDPV